MLRIKIIFGLFILLAFTIQDSLAKDTILVLRTDTKNFSLVLEAIVDDLDGIYHISDMIIDGDTSVADIDDSINSLQPRLIVLIGNHSIAKYSKYQSEHKVLKKNFLPA